MGSDDGNERGYRFDFGEGFEPYPRDVYEEGISPSYGRIQQPISEPYEEYQSGKTLPEKCKDDIREYRKRLAEWKRKKKETLNVINMSKDPQKMFAVFDRINEKINFYQKLIERTEEQRDA